MSLAAAVPPGGQASYGPDAADVAARGACVDRILRGERPADLPVQAPDHQSRLIATAQAVKRNG
ncbi:hypothetical protein [Bradyrhizobium sp. C9]|uniref:hypothetical protein n=1 Tax=Bradyrhizobium sp. C9 TaxID=142585 RepID=UPI0011778C97|nr:hypothetical protein [Bradyrhizobium sp. C9]